MIRLTAREWAILVEMARSFCKNLEDTGDGYWTVGDTLIEDEVALLEKLSQYEPTKRDGLFLRKTNN